MMVIKIKLTAQKMKEVETFVKNGQKINAIKVVRDAAPHIGLREAKDAVDFLDGTCSQSRAKLVLKREYVVESVNVRDDCGNLLQLSLDEMELKFLQQVNSIGLDCVADLLDLTEYIKDWQTSNGKKFSTSVSE
jgi:hypothetical protein